MSYYDDGYAGGGNPICQYIHLPWPVHLGIGLGSIGLLIFGGKYRWYGLAGLAFNVVTGLMCPADTLDIATAKKLLGGYSEDY